MATAEQISGAGYPMKIGNKEYQARTLTDKDYDELGAYVRYKFIEEGKISIDSLFLAKEERQEMLTSLMLASSQVTFNSPEGSRIINLSNEGISRVGWQMIKHYHPQKSFEEFTKEVVGDESQGHLIASLSSINDTFKSLNINTGAGASEDEGDSDKEPKSD